MRIAYVLDWQLHKIIFYYITSEATALLGRTAYVELSSLFYTYRLSCTAERRLPKA